MAEYLIQDTTLDAIADAIRAKTGGSSAMTPAEMVTEIGSIQTGGGGTLRTTHYHGTLSYSNQVVYNPIIPVTDILSTDMAIVVLKLKRTGTVSDGVTTWNDELLIPSAFNTPSVKLWVVSRSTLNFGVISVKNSTASATYSFYVVYGSVRGVYNSNSANDVQLTTTINENGITLTQQGWNIRVCTTGVATEYEYDVYIMTEDGNAIVNGG